MQRQLLKQPPVVNLIALICGLGLVLGIASSWIPPQFILIAIAGIIYIAVAFIWPEIALLAILFLTSTIFDDNSFPSIPIGIGHLLIADILLFVLFGIIILRSLLTSASSIIHTPIDLPLLGFYGTALLATFVGIYTSRISFNQSLGELRAVNLYLTFFLVTNLVRNKAQLHRLFRGVIILGSFVAVAMIAQYILGGSIKILPGRVETLNTAGRISVGITRVLPPGQSLVLVVFVCLVVQLLFENTLSRFISNLVQLGIVGLAVLLTFNRSFWMAIGLALLLVGILISINRKIKYIKIVFWTVIIFALIATPLLTIKGGKGQELMSGILLRMSTMFSPETANEGSLVYRTVENGYAYPQIASHPFIGLGLGAKFRPEDRRLLGTDYIHNGHLYVMLKTGIIGYLFFMSFLLLFIKHGLENWKRVTDPLLKGFVLSSMAVLVGIIFATILNPTFMETNWSPVIGITLGISEVILLVHHDQPLDSISQES